MFFILSKILEFIISPLVWGIILFIVALVSKNQVKKKRFFGAGFVTLVFFTNPFIVNSLMNEWEIKPYSSNKITTEYDVGIVLGGASRSYNADTKRLIYGGGIDRVIQAVNLYHQKKIKKIMLTGGSGLVLMQEIKEAELLKNMLVNWCVPDSDIIIERESRNTYENAKLSAPVLKSNRYGKRFLIITSAFHMRRTMACFHKQGIDADTFSVDEHGINGSYMPDRTFIPDAGALGNWDMLMHEWLGLLTYKLLGYI